MKFKNKAINKINKERFFKVKSQKGNTIFNIREFTYGVLSHDENDPLCCTSQSNSSISIDYWKGCQWQCAYCHVQGSKQDWGSKSNCMGNFPEPRSSFTLNKILESLIQHPFFQPDETILSIGTASTEPFSAYVIDSTFKIMEFFVDKGLKNPFWIVTKASFPPDYQERLKNITKNGNKVLISICWANNPPQIEPVQNNRFRNIILIKEANAYVSWYLRPLADTWNTQPQILRETFKQASKYKKYIDMVVPGGLRWTEGIEYAIEEIKGLKLPPIIKDDNQKFLSSKTIKLIKELHKEFIGEDKPLFFKSSCSLSYLLNVPNINLAQIRNHYECKNSLCPYSQRKICQNYKLPTIGELNNRLEKAGLSEISIISINSKGDITTDPPLNKFTFAIRQKIYHELAKE